MQGEDKRTKGTVVDSGNAKLLRVVKKVIYFVHTYQSAYLPTQAALTETSFLPILLNKLTFADQTDDLIMPSFAILGHRTMNLDVFSIVFNIR